MSILGDIDAQLAHIDEKVAQIIAPEVLEAQVNGSKSLNYNDISKLQQRDYEITEELQQLRELWVVSTLFKEIEVNLELCEFENVFYSLNNLSKKIKSTAFDSNLIILGKLQKEHDRYYELTVSKIIESWEKLVVVEDDSLAFNAGVEINGNSVLFEQVADVIKSNNLQQKIPNNNITHLIDQKLLSALVAGKKLELDDNKIIIKETAPSIEEQIKSVSNLANFINFFEPEDKQIIKYISTRLFEWLKEIISNNIDSVYSNKSIQNQFLELGQFLSTRSFKRNDLQNWIQNELNEIAIEDYVDSHIEKVRTLVRNFEKSDFQTLVTRQYKEDSPKLQVQQPRSQPKPAVKDTTPKQEEEEDGWGWNDDDIDFDDEPVGEEKPEAKQVEADDDEFKDDWDWNDDEEEEEKTKPKPKSKLVSKLAKKSSPAISNESSRQSTPSPEGPPSTYQTTKIPDQIYLIIQSYLSTKTKLPEQYHDLHFSKLNYIITAFYILVSQKFEKFHKSTSQLLLYNDLTYLSELVFIPNLVEMREKYLGTFIKKLNNDIHKHFKQLNGLDPGISASKTFEIVDNIQLIINMNLRSLQFLPIIKTTTIISKVVNDLYQDIIDAVLDKFDIGEDESEYLNLIIKKFLDLKVAPLTLDYGKIPNHSKLGHINFIVHSHLKDIMETFYNAEFWDLSTMELISLIDKLFADSDLKRRSIEEIREIREAE